MQVVLLIRTFPTAMDVILTNMKHDDKDMKAKELSDMRARIFLQNT